MISLIYLMFVTLVTRFSRVIRFLLVLTALRRYERTAGYARHYEPSLHECVLLASESCIVPRPSASHHRRMEP